MFTRISCSTVFNIRYSYFEGSVTVVARRDETESIDFSDGGVGELCYSVHVFIWSSVCVCVAACVAQMKRQNSFHKRILQCVG